MPKAKAVIGPLAVLATASAVTIGVLSADPAASDLAPLTAVAAVPRAILAVRFRVVVANLRALVSRLWRP
jgi:hypothetical protein